MSVGAFTEALAPEYSSALQYCRGLCASWSPEDAEDVLQQSLLEAYLHFGDLRDVTKFRPWLFRIITRTAFRQSRRYFWKRMVPIERCMASEPLPSVFTSESEMAEHGYLYAALSSLSIKERSALLLYEIGGFSIQEIMSVQQEKSVSAVKSRLSRSRKRLRARLENESFDRSNHKAGVNLEQETLQIIRASKTASHELLP